jgi:sugar/nucleoside kinase (ribokinase family)
VFDLVTVGHFTIDSIILPERQMPFVVLGGPAAYVSLAAKRLDTRVSVVSKVGSDFPEAYRWWLEQEGIDISGIIQDKDAQTTRFELRYSDPQSERVLLLKCKAPPISPDDIPASLKADAIHLAPVTDETAYELAERARSHADVLSLDPQGLLRSFDEAGNVLFKPLADKRILNLIDIYRSSANEIEAVTGLSDIASAIEAVHGLGVKIVIVTLGSEGSMVSVGDTTYKVPAYKPEKVVDPTGAGDAFMGGFLAEYVYGENYLRCACVGSALASLVVEGIGPTNFGDKTEIYRRARLLYEKEIKE